MSGNRSQAPSQANSPVQEILIGGVKAAIWQNETEAGIRHNVTFERIYKDGKEWRSTSNFGRDDLLILAKVADQAHTWIIETARKAKPDLAEKHADVETPPLATASITRRK